MEEKDLKTTLATDLLHELKQSSRRWFIAFIVVLTLWFATIGIFIWYITLPVEDACSYVNQNADNASSNNIVEGDYNGSFSDRN